MLIARRLCCSKLFLGSSLKHLKQSFPVEVYRVDQIYGVVYESLFDHIVKEGVTGERRTCINLYEPALQVFIQDDIETVEIKTIRIEGYIILSSH